MLHHLQSPRFKRYAQQSYLGYYAMLAVYAICNLLVLLLGSGMHLLMALPTAMLLTAGAVINELINMQVVTNPPTVAVAAKANLPTLLCTLALWCLALFDVFTSLSNMLAVQLTMLVQLGVFIPGIIHYLYYGLFLFFGISSQAMTMATNLVTALGVHLSESRDKKPSLQSTNHPKGWIQRSITHYLLSDWPLKMGVFVGAFLYANGDFQALHGMLLLGIQAQVFALPSYLSIVLPVACAAATFCERIMIWGANFRRCERENPSDFLSNDQMLSKKSHRAFHMIPESPYWSRRLTIIRSFTSTLRSLFSVMMMYTGWRRHIGLCASVSGVVVSYVQSSFQIQDPVTRKHSSDKSQPHLNNTLVPYSR